MENSTTVSEIWFYKLNRERKRGASETDFITLILNIDLSYLDGKRLKQAGTDTSTFSGWVRLVPVYLYQRSQGLKQNLAYFIVWIVCFLLIIAGLA